MTMAFRVTGLMTAASLVVASTPALAQDDTTQTGLIAALGLEAASGKTTINEGAGAIEASLLASDAMLEAGAIIAGVTKKAVDQEDRVLVISHDQQISLAMVRIVHDRIESVRDYVKKAQCETEYVTADGMKMEAFPGTDNDEPKLIASDIAGAIATDIAISPVKFNFDDRLLVNAVAMNQDGETFAFSRVWRQFKGASEKAPKKTSFVIPGEVSDFGSDSKIRENYKELQKLTDSRRGCTNNEAKAAVLTADALTTTLNAAEKGALSPLEVALQLEPLLATDGKAPARTYILRVAVEQTGGTAIARSGIWYALGFPGASVVSAGLLASFRLVNPQTGVVLNSGIIRCVVPQTPFSRVHRAILNSSDGTACAYRTA